MIMGVRGGDPPREMEGHPTENQSRLTAAGEAHPSLVDRGAGNEAIQRERQCGIQNELFHVEMSVSGFGLAIFLESEECQSQSPK